MAVLDGANTDAVLVLSAVSDDYGTANAATASADKLVCESLASSENPEELELNSIGSGQTMSSDSTRGNVAPSVSIEMVGGYHNAFTKIWAQFLGTSGAPTEQNNPEGDYLHQMTVNSTLNNVFATVAYESSSTTVREFPSVTFSDLTFTAENPASYVRLSASGLADELELSTSTNTNAVVGAAGEEDTERIVIDPADEFLINGQASGALTTSTDRLEITSYSLSLSRPQNFASEIKGSAGNAEPLSGGLMTGTLTITLADSNDNTYEAAAQAGTEYKCSLKMEGSQIGSGDNKKFEIFIPRMKPTEVSYDLSGPGQNGKTIVFKVLAASANPTGMDSTLPYVEFTNEYDSAYIS